MKHHYALNLFPTSKTQCLFPIDILYPIPSTVQDNNYVLAMTSWFEELTRVIPLRNSTASVVANAFLDNSGYIYVSTRCLLADEKSSSFLGFFDAVCSLRVFIIPYEQYIAPRLMKKDSSSTAPTSYSYTTTWVSTSEF